MRSGSIANCFLFVALLIAPAMALAQRVAGNSDGPRAIDHARCDKERASRNCSGREACDASKKQYEQCKVYLQAELDQQKARKEADYKAQKKQEIEAVQKMNRALSQTQKLNGSKH